VVSVTDPYDHILGFIDKSRYFSISTYNKAAQKSEKFSFILKCCSFLTLLILFWYRSDIHSNVPSKSKGHSIHIQLCCLQKSVDDVLPFHPLFHIFLKFLNDQIMSYLLYLLFHLEIALLTQSPAFYLMLPLHKLEIFCFLQIHWKCNGDSVLRITTHGEYYSLRCDIM
jgi:hypothetical protein